MKQQDLVSLVLNILYTVYSCGCDAAANSCNPQNNMIVPLEAVVTLVN